MMQYHTYFTTLTVCLALLVALACSALLYQATAKVSRPAYEVQESR